MIDEDLSPADLAVLDRVRDAFPATSARFDCVRAHDRARQRSRRHVAIAIAATIAVLAGVVGVVRRNGGATTDTATVPSTTISLMPARIDGLNERFGEKLGPTTKALEAYGSLWVTGDGPVIYRYRNADREKAPDIVALPLPASAIVAQGGAIWFATQVALIGSIGRIDPNDLRVDLVRIPDQLVNAAGPSLDIRTRSLAADDEHLYAATATSIVRVDAASVLVDRVFPIVATRLESVAGRLFATDDATGITSEVDVDDGAIGWSAPGRLLDAAGTTLWFDLDRSVETWRVLPGATPPRRVGRVSVDSLPTIAAGANDRAWVFDDISIRVIDSDGNVLGDAPPLGYELRRRAQVAPDGAVWLSAPQPGRYEPPAEARRLVVPPTPPGGANNPPTTTRPAPTTANVPPTPQPARSATVRRIDLVGRESGMSVISIAAGRSALLAVGDVGGVPALWASADGAAWRSAATDGLDFSPGEAPVAVSAHDDGFVVVSNRDDSPGAPLVSSTRVWWTPRLGERWLLLGAFLGGRATGAAVSLGDRRLLVGAVAAMSPSSNPVPWVMVMEVPDAGRAPSSALRVVSFDSVFPRGPFSSADVQVMPSRQGVVAWLTGQGNVSVAALAYSTDGTVWQRHELPDEARDVESFGSLLVTATDDGGLIATQIEGGLRMLAGAKVGAATGSADITCGTSGIRIAPRSAATSGSNVALLAFPYGARPPGFDGSPGPVVLRSGDGGLRWTCVALPEPLQAELDRHSTNLTTIAFDGSGRLLLGGLRSTGPSSNPVIWIVE